MELQELAAIAEIIGLATIIITVAFLGVQVRESNRAMRANVSQAIASSEINYTSQLIHYGEIWNKVITNQPIDDPVESRRSIHLFSLMMIELENRSNQQRLGYMDMDDWKSRETATKLLVNLPTYKQWCEVPGYYSRGLKFRQYLETLRD
jgi:hypothetical protein